MNKIILVIVAHSDDETLGLGGTLSLHSMRGDQVYAMSLTNGISSRDNHLSAAIQERKNSSLRAASILGINWIETADFPDNAMDSVPLIEVVKRIELVKRRVSPSIIYTHSGADLNIDHRIASVATLTAFRPHAGETWEEIRAFEVPSATDYAHKSLGHVFCPNLYIDISETWDKKVKALREYSSEMRDTPNSRSYEGIEALARLRGHQAGVEYAESFEIIRKICRR